MKLKKRRSKYNARKVKIDGIWFDSRKEGKRYKDLKMLLRAGKIKNLELQPEFVLQEGFKHSNKKYRKITYKADFKYYDFDRKQTIVEDTKGFETSVYKIKKKLLLYKYKDIVFIES